MTEWRLKRLGDLIRVKHGHAFKGEFFTTDGVAVVLTPGNFPIGGGLRLRPGKDRYYAGPYPPEFRLSPGDLLVVMTDLTQNAPILGSPAIVPTKPAMLHNQRLGLVTVRPDADLDRRFLYYLLLSDASRSQIRATATGTTVRHTAPERIYRVEMRIPPLRIQRVISSALGAIDYLIDNNRRRAAVLEAMARAIYREWFVHFRCPGHEDITPADAALGVMPRGWERVPLVDAALITMGQSPKSEFYNSDGVGTPFHQGVTDFGQHFPTHRKYCTVAARSAQDGDVLVSVRAPVGRLNIADTRLVIGRGLAAIQALDGRQGLMFAQLVEVFTEEDSMGGGTIFKAIGKTELEQVKVLRVPDELADIANRVLSDNLDLIRTLTMANRRLVSIRDSLLPKLVTGQIDVLSLGLDALVEGSVA